MALIFKWHKRVYMARAISIFRAIQKKPESLNGTKYLNGIKGFKWHMPFKSFMSFKKLAFF